jgi:pheromone shutdown-related protein TraB
MLPAVDGPLEIINLSHGRTLYLFGTAHVSEKSANDVKALVDAIAPKQIAIELCQQRFESLQNPEQWKNTDIFTLIKSGKSSVLLVQLILASYQKRIAAKLKVKPGAEMHMAIECANKNSIPISLIDRDIKITLRRAWAQISILDTFKIILSSVFSTDTDKEITESEIESLKNEDALSSALKEFSDQLPKLKHALVDERDIYMASMLQECKEVLSVNTSHNPVNILAVVGAGHVPGMTKLLREANSKTIDRIAISKIPPPTLTTKFLIYGLPAILAILTVYIFIVFDYKTGLAMLGTWCFTTGICAAIGATLALAHPLSIITAGVIAPFAALHPGIATGWVSGLVEAWLRKPTVSDFENISEELSTLKGLWSNRVMRTLLVVAFSNLGCMVGMWFGSAQLAGKIL